MLAAGALASRLGGPALAAPVPPSVGWPTAGFDPARIGANPRESITTTPRVPNLRQSWAHDLDGSAITAQPSWWPTIANGAVHHGNGSGALLTALDVTTGATLLRYPLTG